MRRCVVTGESYPRAQLLRFVASPEGVLVFDVKANLPGRGIWVYPKSDYVEQAIEKKLFARGAKQAVKVPEDLIERVEKILKQRMLNLLQRAWQSRQMVSGFEKVASALRNEESYLLLHASDAAEDGCRKLNKLVDDSARIVSSVGREELAQALGMANPVHLSIQSVGMAKSFMAAYKVWAGFLQKDTL